MIETSPQNRHLGYARVSTYGQTLDAQLQQFRAEGCAKVYREKARGAKTDRVQLRTRPAGQRRRADGDALRPLGALSTRDLLNTLATITGKGAGFRSLHDTWADTTTAHGRLMLTVLGGLAEFERELIRGRTGKGRERAKRLRRLVEAAGRFRDCHDEQRQFRHLDRRW